MSDVSNGGGRLRADSAPSGARVARNTAVWLGLAAAPVFALMALLTATSESADGILCSAAHGSSTLSGMTLMYAAMSIFHAPPWLRLISK